MSFKSLLHEYAQKKGFNTPIYETIQEGPSHQPFFSSKVTINNITYCSLCELPNRKAAEQSAAEVALEELRKAAELNPRGKKQMEGASNIDELANLTKAKRFKSSESSTEGSEGNPSIKLTINVDDLVKNLSHCEKLELLKALLKDMN